MRRVLAIATLLACATVAAAPVEVTTSGQIVLSCDGAEVSRHDIETEMTQSAINAAVAKGGKASCTAVYPSKSVVVDLTALLCPAKPADQNRTAQCAAPSVGSWPQTQTWSGAPAPTCWVGSGFLPVDPPAGACVVPPPPNRAPTISGTPVAAIVTGQAYSFTPTAADPDGDTIGFTIQNKPSWAGFETSTGKLWGVPAPDKVGIYSSIVITVSDGNASASTSAFSITVTAPPPPPPVDCVVSAWSDWVLGTPGACVNGQQSRVDTRSRTVTTPAANGGAACPALTESRTVPLTCTSPPPTETWAKCATEPALCSFTGTRRVRYGIDPNWVYANLTAVSGGALCQNATFGSDPIQGTRKACWLSSTTTPPANRAPTIAGSPASSVVAGQAYAFQPSAADADGDTLQWTITNKPAWATFSSSTGKLSGTPAAAQAGVSSNIVIAVSDGQATTSLPAFSITVTVSQPANGSATLSWTPPTQNTDGSTLANLAGYRIAYGTSSAALTQTIQVANASMATYVVTSLAPGTWFFAVRAYSSSGAESANSNTASKTIQ